MKRMQSFPPALSHERVSCGDLTKGFVEITWGIKTNEKRRMKNEEYKVKHEK